MSFGLMGLILFLGLDRIGDMKQCSFDVVLCNVMHGRRRDHGTFEHNYNRSQELSFRILNSKLRTVL